MESKVNLSRLAQKNQGASLCIRVGHLLNGAATEKSIKLKLAQQLIEMTI